MAQDHRKLEKKRKKEAAKAKRAFAYVAAKKREAARPRVTIDPAGGDPVFVKRVQNAIAHISLEESGGCPADIAELIARFRRDGPEETLRHLRSQAALQYDHHQEIINESQLIQHRAIAHV